MTMQEIKDALTLTKALTKSTAAQWKAQPPEVGLYEATQGLTAGMSKEDAYVFTFAVACCNDTFRVNGGYWPTPESAYAQVGGHDSISLEEIKEVWRTTAFSKACYLRGIRPRNGGLDERMLLTLSVMTNYLDRRSPSNKLRSMGVSELEYQSWLEFEPFRIKLNQLANKALDTAQAGVDMALTQRALEGDIPAVVYFNKLTGRFNENTQQLADVQGLLRALVDIVTSEVTDPQTLMRIGSRMQLAATANGIKEL